MKRNGTGSRFPWKVFTRLVLFQSGLVLIALISTGIGARFYFKKTFLTQVELQLKDTLQEVVKNLPVGKSPTEQWCQGAAQGTELRLTVIGQDGSVVCDSHHTPESMDNHSSRPEVVGAREGHPWSSIRFSQTLQESMLYEALPAVQSGLIVRGALPLSNLNRTLDLFDRSLTAFSALLALVLGLFAIGLGRELVAPLTRLLEKVLVRDSGPATEDLGTSFYGEWGELEKSINRIQRDRDVKVETLRLERDQQATLMSSISDAILAVDPDGHPLFYNTQFSIQFGKHDLSGQAHLWELFREPEILDTFRNALKEGRESTVSSFPFELNSKKYSFSLRVSPLRRDEREVYGAIGVFHDITELKAADQMRIDFVANVSHELRTPLTALKANADTLLLDLKEGRGAEAVFVEAIARNVDRLRNLIQDLLDLSVLDSTERVKREKLDPEEVTDQILKQLSQNFRAKNQQVTLEVKASGVYADISRLEQILVNLLDNANKYTPSGGTIQVSWLEEGRDTVLRVSDSGPGIPPEHQSRLFERFYRVDQARSRDLGGTGLGLAIVKHIMQKHFGSVEVQSKNGEGSTFICRFPSP